jgi:antitoxin (DNA-binding transcriptional repressor) of toxin-antitoxin stability system
MKRVPIAEFKAHCSQLIEELGQDEIVITKHGKAVARVVAEPKPTRRDVWEFYESLKGKYPPPPDDLSTGREWDAQSRH